MDQSADSKIEKSADTTTQADNLAGVPEGTVDKFNPNLKEAERERIVHAEKVVIERDAEGNEIGWHKEPADEGGAN